MVRYSASTPEGISKADKLDLSGFGFRYPDTDDPANDPKGPGRSKPVEQIVADMHDPSKPAQETFMMVDSDYNVLESFDIAPMPMGEEIALLTKLANNFTSTAFGMHCEMANESQAPQSSA